MELAEKYLSCLTAVRMNSSRLSLFQFEDSSTLNEDRRIERLRLATALFNDLRSTDHQLVQFLFIQELKMKCKDPADVNMYNLRLIGLLLTKFTSPEDIWLLFDAHKLDNDFDIRFVSGVGTSRLFDYLQTSTHKDKPELLTEIGMSIQTSKYTQQEIDSWLEDEEDFFDGFRFPLKDEFHLAAILKEKERVRELLPQWIEGQKEWTDKNLFQCINYVQEYSDDINLEIRLLKLYTSQYENKLAQGYRTRLAELCKDRES